MNYFKNCKSIEDLKKEYKIQVMRLHPDISGRDSTAEFQDMQNEYEKAFEGLKNVHINSKGEFYNKETSEDVGEYRDIINKIIFFVGVNIEIIGTWIWVSGNTKTYCKELKELGFKWSVNKMAWSYHSGEYRKWSKSKYSMDELRVKFGTVAVDTKDLVLTA